MEQENRVRMERIAADPQSGLSAEQVKRRFAQGENNYKVESSTLSVSEIVRSNVCTYFNLVFAVIAVLLAIVGAWSDMLFLPIIVANTCIGIIQEVHSKKVLDKLSILNAPHAVVIRDGKRQEIPADQLVLDDIVEFSAGSQIPADAKVVSGELQVNESLITGESDEIEKREGDSLLSGSFVVSGKACARLEKVGKDSYISKLTLQATKSKKGEQSEMIRSLNYLIMVMGIIIIPIGIALFVQSFIYNEGTFHDSITGMVAAIIGMIPEGLYLLTSVALAVSSVRLAQKKVLIHDMKCIETLARVNVLCVDKTGTITEPGMHVYDFSVLDGADQLEISQLLADFVAAQEKDNATMEALKAHFSNGSGMRAREVYSFSSETKYSGAVMNDGKSYVIGAPEFVLRGQFAQYQEQIATYSSKGYRVLVFAQYEGTLDRKPLTEPVLPLCFVMLANPIRKGAKETFTYFAENDVDIKVISGDNPLTVSVIAAEAGIVGAERFVDASTLKEKEDYYRAVEEYTVFGRVTPSQKRMLVQALKEHKKTVAMTGDGVNDVLALKDADCGIAMASGAQAASQVAQLVLLDSDFAALPGVVAEGRRVINNIQRSASLFLVKNIFSFLLSIVALALPLAYPFQPLQLSLVTFATIGAPAFFLALEPNHELVHGKFMRNVLRKALPGGLTDFLLVFCAQGFGYAFDIPSDMVGTICTLVILCVGLQILWGVCIPFTPLHWAIWGSMTVAGVGGAFLLARWLPLVRLDLGGTLVLVVLLALSAPTLAGLVFMGERLHGMVNDWKNKKARKHV